MSDIYQFSQSSLELLGHCISAANQPEIKWIEFFKRKETAVKVENISLSDHGSQEQDTLYVPSETIVESNTDEQDEQMITQTENDQVERIAAVLEAEPSKKVEYIIEQSTINNNLLPALAEKLSAGCIETICEELFENRIFHEDILKHFVMAYIKKETCSNTLSLLLRAFKTRQATTLAITESLFLEMDISSKLLEEFFNAIDKKSCAQFLQTISGRQLVTDLFIQRINIFNQLYKCSEKTEEIQNFLLNELLKSCQLCRADKSYGRCLLTFFQSLQDKDEVNVQHLDKLIASHQTPYKRLSQSFLEKLCKG